MEKCKNIKFGGKATYKIRVQGKLDTSWSDSLGGLDIETEQISDNQFMSTLTGLIADQAALSGILNTLYELHLPVISVKCICAANDDK